MQLEVASGRGRRAALEAALRDAIRAGRIPAQATLPSSRSLAADLGFSRSTVVGAYEQLTAEGYLVSEQGRGTSVAASPYATTEEPVEDLFGAMPRWDFRPGEPDATSFPAKDWLSSLRRSITQHPHASLGYSDPRGCVELRVALAEHLGRTRSVAANPNAIFVCSGFAAGLGFLADTFRAAGRPRIGVEEAMLPFHRYMLKMAGLELVTIPVDEHGLDTTALEAANVAAVLVTPANHYPYGVTMSPERRAQLIEWSIRNESWIVEDDYDGEFRYDRRPIGALQGLAPDRVIYGGTASKSLAPGLRIGWLVVPAPLREQLLATMNIRGGVSTPEQHVLADMISRGRLDRHVRLMRRVYRQRRDDLLHELGTQVPWLEVDPAAAGLQLSTRLPATVSEASVLDAAERHDVGVLTMCGFHYAPSHRSGLSIGFSRLAQHDFATGVKRLVTMLAECSP